MFQTFFLFSLDPASTYTKLLFTYGPFALLVFSAYVLERKARDQRSSAPNSRLALAIYVATWALIFSMAVTITVVWYKLNVTSREFHIRGRLAGLQGDEQLRTRFKQMFLRREYENRSQFDYDWIIFTPKKLDPGSHILLVVDRSTPPDHEDIAAYELPVVDAYYESDTEMELLYDRTNRTISFEVGTEKTVLKPVEYHSELPHTRLGGWTRYFTDLAYAQSAPNLREISKDLQSTDPILRLEARARLAEMGQRSIPYIQEVLTDKKSPYFAKLGAISALNKVNEIPLNALNQPTRCAIVLASFDDDHALRYEAEQFVQKSHGIETPAQCGFTPTTPLNCISPEIRLDMATVSELEYQDAFGYLAGIAAHDDILDLYIFRTSTLAQAARDKMNRAGFKRFVKSLKQAQDKQLLDKSFIRVKMRRGENITLNTESGIFRLKVTETHFFKDYALVQICK